MVIFGGKTDQKVLNDIHILDVSTYQIACFSLHTDMLMSLYLDTRQWRQPDICRLNSLKEQPQPRYGHSAVKADDQMFIFGGTNGKEDFHDLWGFNFGTINVMLPVLPI